MNTVSLFDKSAQADNAFALDHFMFMGRKAFARRVSWRTAFRKYAEMKGGAFCMLADDSLLVLTKRPDGKFSQRTFKPGTWRWA